MRVRTAQWRFGNLLIILRATRVGRNLPGKAISCVDVHESQAIRRVVYPRSKAARMGCASSKPEAPRDQPESKPSELQQNLT